MPMSRLPWASALAQRASDLTTRILARGNEIAAARGILIADTKVEFGIDGDELVLADEVLTPDSSRFWPADQWEPGHTQPSFDKEFVREWLISPASGWDKASGQAPPPLPDEVLERTRAKYVEAYERLTGRTFAADGSESPAIAGRGACCARTWSRTSRKRARSRARRPARPCRARRREHPHLNGLGALRRPRR